MGRRKIRLVCGTLLFLLGAAALLLLVFRPHSLMDRATRLASAPANPDKADLPDGRRYIVLGHNGNGVPVLDLHSLDAPDSAPIQISPLPPTGLLLGVTPDYRVILTDCPCKLGQIVRHI